MGVTAGTWGGLPDFGITEGINNALGGALNTFGNLFVNPNQAQSIGPQSGPIQQGMTTQQANQVATVPTNNTTTQPANKVSTGGGSAPVQNQTQNNGVQPPNTDQLGSYYNGVDQDLQNQYNTQLANQGNFISQYTSPYDALLAQAQGSYQQGQGNIAQGQQTAQSNYENVIDQAKNAYNQLVQGYQQRFGGANSAGNYMQALLGQGFQQQLGSANSQLGQNQYDIQKQQSDLTNQYAAQQQTIKAQQNQAQGQAQTAFSNILQQIQNNKTMLDTQKASTLAGAMQQYQQMLYNINANTQYIQSQLDAQLQANQAKLGTSLGSFGTLAGNMGQTNVTSYAIPNQATQQYAPQQTAQNGAYTAGSNITGNTGTQTKYDQFGNPIQ